MRHVLLVEPGYRNKYPPLGLMKISAYHKRRGDVVRFVKGCDKAVAGEHAWDRVYVSSLFTFHWNTTLKAIRFYQERVRSGRDVWVGGVMATLLADELSEATGATVMKGLLDKPGALDADSPVIVDQLTPDYSILEETEYQYGTQDAYMGYATRGCPNRCGFCAVRTIEPDFVGYVPLKRQIQALEMLYGERPNLVLLDNNVLASSHFEQIVDDLVEMGFQRGSRTGKRLRTVDFNQGTDARLVTPENMKLLARVAVRPLRLAFDDIALRSTYERAVRLAAENGITHLSNYVLFNYKDTPEDFHERLRINLQLNTDLKLQIYSFPMKYVPLDAHDRTFVGEHWNRRLLRGVQCILVATRGMVGPKQDFFDAAFGATAADFRSIAMMPEDYIVHRHEHALNGAAAWRRDYSRLTQDEMLEFVAAVSVRPMKPERAVAGSTARLRRLLAHYVDHDVSHTVPKPPSTPPAPEGAS